LNDAGQLAFSVSFMDSTEAVIVASIQPGGTDADGDVDLEDLNNVRNNFGESSVSSAVPEPSALLIPVVGAIPLGLARRQLADKPAARRD